MIPIYFGSNLAAPDFLRMFTHPEEWAETRERIAGVRIASEHIMAGTEPGYLLEFQKRDIGMRPDGTLINTFAALAHVNAFRKVNSWGKELVLGVGVIKPGLCDGAAGEQLALRLLERITATGARVNILIIDSPLSAALNHCGLTPEQAADIVARFTRTIHARYPYIAIGFVDHYSVISDFYPFIMRLEKVSTPPAFVSVDVDRHALREEDWWQRVLNFILSREPAKVRTMRAVLAMLFLWLEARNIPSVVEIWGQGFTDARSYRKSVIDWARIVASFDVRPSALMVESWEVVNESRAVPHNLPESDPLSHTGLVKEISAIFAA